MTEPPFIRPWLPTAAWHSSQPPWHTPIGCPRGPSAGAGDRPTLTTAPSGHTSGGTARRGDARSQDSADGGHDADGYASRSPIGGARAGADLGTSAGRVRCVRIRRATADASIRANARRINSAQDAPRAEERRVTPDAGSSTGGLLVAPRAPRGTTSARHAARRASTPCNGHDVLKLEGLAVAIPWGFDLRARARSSGTSPPFRTSHARPFCAIPPASPRPVAVRGSSRSNSGSSSTDSCAPGTSTRGSWACPHLRVEMPLHGSDSGGRKLPVS